MHDTDSTDTAMAEAFAQAGFDTDALTVHDIQEDHDAEERHASSPSLTSAPRRLITSARFKPNAIFESPKFRFLTMG